MLANVKENGKILNIAFYWFTWLKLAKTASELIDAIQTSVVLD